MRDEKSTDMMLDDTFKPPTPLCCLLKTFYSCLNIIFKTVSLETYFPLGKFLFCSWTWIKHNIRLTLCIFGQ